MLTSVLKFVKLYTNVDWTVNLSIGGFGGDQNKKNYLTNKFQKGYSKPTYFCEYFIRIFIAMYKFTVLIFADC